ncbi:hypothetical protein CK203_042172 [Vitis vinifera]|uniref:Uncharacterized protein n=1 Tax=Vitis vinifera TaxID=29760 RepID=A0A438HPT8_VITVI|nr:hypothetical protein CK203_042172 [Vitis vinifera]
MFLSTVDRTLDEKRRKVRSRDGKRRKVKSVKKRRPQALPRSGNKNALLPGSAVTQSRQKKRNRLLFQIVRNKTQNPENSLEPNVALIPCNRIEWSQVVKMFLKGKGKLSHLFSTGPKQSDPKFQNWDEDDSMIMSWL